MDTKAAELQASSAIFSSSPSCTPCSRPARPDQHKTRSIMAEVNEFNDRIIDEFPSGQQDQIRLQLAASLAGIFSQRLVPRISGG